MRPGRPKRVSLGLRSSISVSVYLFSSGIRVLSNFVVLQKAGVDLNNSSNFTFSDAADLIHVSLGAFSQQLSFPFLTLVQTGTSSYPAPYPMNAERPA